MTTTTLRSEDAVRDDRPWRYVTGDDTVVVAVGERWRLARVAPGTPVALLDTRPGSRRRCRRAARLAGIEIEHEYVVLPTLGRPLFLAEDDRVALRWLIGAQLAVPPGWPSIAGLALRVVRLLPSRLVAAVIPGRVVVGSRVGVVVGSRR